jgi:hypothetical protein
MIEKNQQDNSKDKKQELLDTLKQIKQTTRKPRNDKGKSRGPNSKKRSDAGIPRSPSLAPKNPLTVYFIVKNRLFNSAKNEEYNVCQDIDGYFIPRPGPTKQVYKNYIVNNHGLRIPRTVKNVQGKDVDLEAYRYHGLQDKAITLPLELIPITSAQQLVQELNKTGATNWLELFTRWYAIDEEKVLTTSYEQWRIDHYGEPDRDVQRLSLLHSKRYEDMYARVRDEEYSKVFEKLKIEVINHPEHAHLTMLQIEKVVRQQIKTDGWEEYINNKITEKMDRWVEEQQKQ